MTHFFLFFFWEFSILLFKNSMRIDMTKLHKTKQQKKLFVIRLFETLDYWCSQDQTLDKFHSIQFNSNRYKFLRTSITLSIDFYQFHFFFQLNLKKKKKRKKNVWLKPEEYFIYLLKFSWPQLSEFRTWIIPDLSFIPLFEGHLNYDEFIFFFFFFKTRKRYFCETQN